MQHEWNLRKRPVRLERRYDFSDYEATRDFLDEAAALSEKTGIYPDMSFGRTYVNATMHVEDGETEPSEAQHAMAADLDRLVKGVTIDQKAED